MGRILQAVDRAKPGATRNQHRALPDLRARAPVTITPQKFPPRARA